MPEVWVLSCYLLHVVRALRLRLLERVAKPGPAGQKAEYAHGRGPRYRFRLESDQDGA